MPEELDPLKLEAYRTALQARNLEINLFWQRSNYFLILNTAIGTGFFAVRSDEFAYLLGGLGLVSAWLWLRVNLGSKFWQSRWEERLHRTEKELAPEGINLFGADWPTVMEDVRASLSDHFHEPGRVARAYERAVLGKPSVTRMMTYLSGAFLAFWVVGLIGLFVRDYF
jgi:hypothetical protein